MSSVSVLVPTWRRPDDLRRCLLALERQGRPAEHVVVSYRADDDDTRRVLADFPRVTAAEVPAGTNLVGSMNAGLARTTGAFVALTDDDAEPRPDWIGRLLPYFDDEAVGGVGGRDDQVANPGEARDVGRVQWFGRVIGNHHLGVGPPRDVDVLKGVNCCFRGDLLRGVGFDRRLRGKGNVNHWELSLCLRLRRDGWRLVYDPAIRVDHNPGPRHDGDVNQRGGFDAESLGDMAFNETLGICEHLPSSRRLAYMAWSLAAGTGKLPGFAQALRLLAKGRRHVGSRLLAAAGGRQAAHRLAGRGRANHLTRRA